MNQLEIWQGAQAQCSECNSEDLEICVWTGDIAATPSEYFCSAAPLMRCRGCGLSAIHVKEPYGILSAVELFKMVEDAGSLDELDRSFADWAGTTIAVVNEKDRTVWVDGELLSRNKIEEFKEWSI